MIFKLISNFTLPWNSVTLLRVHIGVEVWGFRAANSVSAFFPCFSVPWTPRGAVAAWEPPRYRNQPRRGSKLNKHKPGQLYSSHSTKESGYLTRSVRPLWSNLRRLSICLFARKEERGKLSSAITKVTGKWKARTYEATFHRLVSPLMFKWHR